MGFLLLNKIKKIFIQNALCRKELNTAQNRFTFMAKEKLLYKKNLTMEFKMLIIFFSKIFSQNKCAVEYSENFYIFKK